MRRYRRIQGREFREGRYFHNGARESYFHDVNRNTDVRKQRSKKLGALYQDAITSPQPKLVRLKYDDREEMAMMNALVEQVALRREREIYLLKKSGYYITEILICGALFGLLFGFLRNPIYYSIFVVFSMLAAQHIIYQHRMKA